MSSDVVFLCIRTNPLNFSRRWWSDLYVLGGKDDGFVRMPPILQQTWGESV